MDDYPPEHDHKLQQHCEGDHVAATLQPEWDISLGRTQIFLCPLLFNLGTIGGGPGREWSGAATRKCDNIGNRVSNYMHTLGSAMLHEYTHAPDLVVPPLEDETDDHVYSFYNTRNLKNKEEMAKENADSFSLFAIELTWMVLCNREFAAPVDGNSPRFSATDNQGTINQGSSAKGSSSKGSGSKGSGSKGSGSKGSSSKGSSSRGSSSKGTNAKRQSPRHEIQSNPLLDKRLAFSQAYQHPVPKTNIDNTYTVEQMDQFLEGHIDALQLCRVAIKQSTKNPTRFDKVFREYFDPNDRALVISKFLIRWEPIRSAEAQ